MIKVPWSLCPLSISICFFLTFFSFSFCTFFFETFLFFWVVDLTIQMGSSNWFFLSRVKLVMNKQKGHHYVEEMSSSSKVVIVAVKASKYISRTALVWALTHVVQPGDCIKLLVIIPELSSSIVITLSFISIFVYNFICFWSFCIFYLSCFNIDYFEEKENLN